MPMRLRPEPHHRGPVSSMRACHPPAFFRALLACLRALLAMRMLMLRAFLGAGLADVGAQRAELLRKVASSRHEG